MALLFAWATNYPLYYQNWPWPGYLNSSLVDTICQDFRQEDHIQHDEEVKALHDCLGSGDVDVLLDLDIPATMISQLASCQEIGRLLLVDKTT